MIHHIVLFKIRQDITVQDINAFLDGLRSLHQIQGVISVSCGETTKSDWYATYRLRNAEYNYCLLVVLQDEIALEYYENDKLHNEIKNKYILPNVDSEKSMPIMAVDFDSDIFSKN